MPLWSGGERAYASGKDHELVLPVGLDGFDEGAAELAGAACDGDDVRHCVGCSLFARDAMVHKMRWFLETERWLMRMEAVW